MIYEVVNPRSWHSFGLYEAETPEAAIEACCRDAGYDDVAHTEQVTGEPCELIAILRRED